MRSTQLQTLRAVAAGADTVARVAERLGIPESSAKHRMQVLAREEWLFSYRSGLRFGKTRTWELTDRARALLETRARLDGETMT